jgi:hypothetical protein
MDSKDFADKALDIEITELEHKTKIFERKKNNPELPAETRSEFARKAERLSIKLAQLKKTRKGL